MIGFLTVIQVVVCIFLIIVILMQSGRRGGLTEGFASAESIFGAKTNIFMVRTTTVLATLFLVTCLGLVILSSQRKQSLMANQAIPPVSAPAATEPPISNTPVVEKAPLQPAPSTSQAPLAQPEPSPGP